MPMYYNVAMPNTLCTTSGTTNTEVDDMFIKAGANTVWLQAIYIMGRMSAQTVLNGITFAVKLWTTASTAGTAITPSKRDARNAAATTTAASIPTPGSGGGTYVGPRFGCSATGPGGWTAETGGTFSDAALSLMGSATASLDVYSVATGLSLTHDVSLTIGE
jgi:hypothetical protein